uniref:Uncharacterized protein n=1 Tax=Amphimedon queenslandica TaxID=400682 RepID=A0A1X7V8Q0_AMPQE
MHKTKMEVTEDFCCLHQKDKKKKVKSSKRGHRFSLKKMKIACANNQKSNNGISRWIISAIKLGTVNSSPTIICFKSSLRNRCPVDKWSHDGKHARLIKVESNGIYSRLNFAL